MSLINTQTTLRVEDFPTEQRTWIDKLLFPLNQFTDACISAVNGNITLGDNIPCQTQVMSFVYGGPADFPKNFLWKISGKPVEVRVAAAMENGVGISVAIAWSYDSAQISIAQMVKITTAGVSSLTPGASYIITLRGQP